MKPELKELLREIREEVAETASYTGRAQLNERVLSKFSQVPRDQFVPERRRASAYVNHALSIGYGQTISQPYMVALMTDLLDPEPHHICLEVGTGCGYQAAVLSRLVKQVYSLEIIPELAAEAKQRLQALGYDNITVRCGDGYQGWPEMGPFDSIIVTAGAEHIPPPLIEQLRPGGRMAIPVGDRLFGQKLLLITKEEDGEVNSRTILPVAFVPLTGPDA
ncbi:protein-L-isoaspartate(D-aspartate) O-methyltransferase [Aestuariicella hydrocarbonica]|uniref:Protein-L-isoaspartate O-methyltransferase n=1 Tax=Pseudomaricurvus hydrocarbonicus TaxID=1470433 RepID=A0A9E5MLI4_9GAMM|nr:protein-L-isoaspartate(D-aspartate) O-methyltransferase [Aestuariicella hydrocarbonica]NHO64598.1 protein-L-isoaspartate(D-aspartate) O-methyltransferase [Aestuariicella hydrocarbonica]